MNYCCNVLNLLAWSIEGITQKTFIDILSCYLCKDGDKKNECCNINQTILRCQLLMAYMYSPALVYISGIIDLLSTILFQVAADLHDYAGRYGQTTKNYWGEGTVLFVHVSITQLLCGIHRVIYTQLYGWPLHDFPYCTL